MSSTHQKQEIPLIMDSFCQSYPDIDDVNYEFSPQRLGNLTLTNYSPMLELIDQRSQYQYSGEQQYTQEYQHYDVQPQVCNGFCRTNAEHCPSCNSIKKRSIRKIKPNLDPSIRKNFPKLLGNHFLAHLEQIPAWKLPDPIELFKQDELKKKRSKKQLSFAIEDFRKLCLASQESKAFFIDFLQFKFPVRLIHSNKFTQIEPVNDLISNAIVGACNPEQWKGNMQIAKQQ
ncbi:unnamed protein product [Paramecium octaurelia]|uniref:Uncharacterized protein n=1 Tax=Paramecium octaurelia TaxID=43137 RepID=A0A8S1WZX6_PAROT|nr:unnamed protein product [Paramecium octaurelia]